MDQQKEGLVCLPGLGLEKDMIDSLGDNGNWFFKDIICD